MRFSIQPRLESDTVILEPLQAQDFEEVYAVASDPKIWEQHPNKDRWKREVFQVFFEGAIKSGGAYKIIDKTTSKVIGSTRFYDLDVKENKILIGYTFYAKSYWGKGFNHAVKTLMLDYIFQHVSSVHFHIGADNVRSQISISRLGTTKVGELVVPYFGEPPKLNYVYSITKEEWFSYRSME